MATSVSAQARIDPVTIAGLALVLMPLLTMLHELGGHAGMCLASGGRLLELGAFYVDCASSDAAARRAVSLAGPGIDALTGLVGFVVWKRLTNDMARLVAWYIWLSTAFSAAGYMLFSGLTGLGDLGAAGNQGIGPLPMPVLWQALIALAGAIGYVCLIRLGIVTLAQMVGSGLKTRTAKRIIAHLFYAVLCVAALLASLPNPVGVFVTLASAVAASFGGKAGLISIGFAPGRRDDAREFRIKRSWALLVAGLAITIGFALILGPTIRFAAVSGVA